MRRWLVPLGTASFVTATLVLRRYLSRDKRVQRQNQPSQQRLSAILDTQGAVRVQTLLASSSSADASPRRKEPQQRFRAGRRAAQGLRALWTKFNNDWVMNLAAMLAYNLLMSIVPILAMFLSFFGLFLGGLAPGSEQQFISQIGAAVPDGRNLIEPALRRLAASSGIFAVLTILLSAWFGSRLFITIEQCFGVIFRLPPRDFVRQNSIALGMMMLFVILIPVLLAVSVAPSFLTTTLVNRFLGESLAGRIWLIVATAVAGYLIASSLFMVIYVVMPN